MKKHGRVILCAFALCMLSGCRQSDNRFKAIDVDYTEEITTEEVVLEETEEPTTEEPSTEEPSTEEPSTEEQTTKETTTEQRTENPVTTEATTEEKEDKTEEKTTEDKKKPGKKPNKDKTGDDDKGHGDDENQDSSENHVTEEPSSEEKTTEQVKEALLEGISYDGKFKSSYYTGEDASFSTREVTAKFDDGTTKKISFDECDITGFNTSSAGNGKVVITYKGKTISLAYSVEDGNIITGFSVSGSIPIIPKGGSLDSSGLSIQITYVSGKTASLSLGDCSHNFDSSSEGNKTLKISYGDFSDEVSYTVKRFTIKYVVMRDVYVDGALASSTTSASKTVESSKVSFGSASDLMSYLGVSQGDADEIKVTKTENGKSIGFPISFSESNTSVTAYIHLITNKTTD